MHGLGQTQMLILKRKGRRLQEPGRNRRRRPVCGLLEFQHHGVTCVSVSFKVILKGCCSPASPAASALSPGSVGSDRRMHCPNHETTPHCTYSPCWERATRSLNPIRHGTSSCGFAAHPADETLPGYSEQRAELEKLMCRPCGLEEEPACTGWRFC